jgi:hypothetical protein
MIYNIGISGITGPEIFLKDDGTGMCLHGEENDRPHKIFYTLTIFDKPLFEYYYYKVYELSDKLPYYSGVNNDELYVTKGLLDELLMISKNL